MKRIFALLGAALMTAATLAGTTVISKPGDWALKKQGDTTNTVISRHATFDDCQKAAPAGKYKCDTSVALEVTGTCDDVAKKEIPRELDADGFVIKPPIRGKEPATGNDWTTEIQDWVPAPYPACWVLGWREIVQADLEPDDLLQANSVEPMPTPAGFDAEYHTEAAEAFRHETHVCYSDDKTPCPPLAPVPTACGEEFCGVRG